MPGSTSTVRTPVDSHPNLKFLAAALLIACFTGLGFASPAVSAPVGTRVVLDSSGSRLYGYVRTASPARCSAGRVIAVKKLHNGRPATRAGFAKSRKAGKAWQWSLAKSSATGSYRAKVLAKPGCAGSGLSRTEKISTRSGSDPVCPVFHSGSDSHCIVGYPRGQQDGALHFFTYPITGTCPSISDGTGACEGITDHGSGSFDTDSGAHILWSHMPDSIHFLLDAGGSTLQGHLPGAGSNRFTVVGGKLAGHEGRLCTLDLPGVAPGQTGGPLDFDFENEFSGAEVYFVGEVKRARSSTEC